MQGSKEFHTCCKCVLVQSVSKYRGMNVVSVGWYGDQNIFIFTPSYIVLHDGLRYFPDHDRPVHGRRHEVAGEVFEAWDGDCEVQDRTRMFRQLLDAARYDRIFAHRVDPLLHLDMDGTTQSNRGERFTFIYTRCMSICTTKQGSNALRTLVHYVHYTTTYTTTYTTHVVESQPYSNTCSGNDRYRCLAPPHYRLRERKGCGGGRGSFIPDDRFSFTLRIHSSHMRKLTFQMLIKPCA